MSFIMVMAFMILSLVLWMFSVSVSDKDNALFQASLMSVFLALMAVVWFMKSCLDKAKLLRVLDENEEERRYVNN